MPPSEKASRTAIIEAALAVVDKQGLTSLTARRVASALELSTAPVYRQFDSMDALASAVMERARRVHRAGIHRLAFSEPRHWYCDVRERPPEPVPGAVPRE
jgi:AcrR family transcriptional regulator